MLFGSVIGKKGLLSEWTEVSSDNGIPA